MGRKVTPIPFVGRPEYSAPITIEIPTPRPGIKTLIQSPYWATGIIEEVPPPGFYVAWLVEKGYDQKHEWIPPKTRFILDKFIVSVPTYTTIEVGVGYQSLKEKGIVVWLLWQTGKQSMSLDFTRLRDFKEYERPIYAFGNLGDVTPAYIEWTAIGVEEKIE